MCGGGYKPEMTGRVGGGTTWHSRGSWGGGAGGTRHVCPNPAPQPFLDLLLFTSTSIGKSSLMQKPLTGHLLHKTSPTLIASSFSERRQGLTCFLISKKVDA